MQSGQVLAVLDDAEVRRRLGQAQEHLGALQAQFHQAETDVNRFRHLLERKVVPVREFDQVKARYETLQAQAQQARQAVNEAPAYFRYGKVIHLRLQEGVPLKEAVVETGAVRLMIIFLTAGAAMFGSWVITLGPVFSGLAWSFIFGIFAPTIFTLLVVR